MADQKKVVFEYLEALLQDPDLDAPEVEPKTESKPVEPPQESPAAEDLAEDASPIDSPEPTITVEPEPEPAEPEPAPQAAVPKAPPPEAKALGAEVNCILLDMHGLKLAVPFEQVEGALQLEDLSMSLEGPEWMIGRFGTDPAWTRIVDTARWLIPERYKPEYSKYSEVIILRGRRWALACDELIKSVRIPTSGINWNHDREHRSWLLGTYMPERCAVLDIEQLLLEFEACSA